MKGRKLIYIIVAAVVLHVVGFGLVCGFHPLPKERRVEGPNFRVREKAFTDESTGEHLVYREITVSTKLAAPVGPPVDHQ